jgi:hypothetical protein
VLTLGTFNLAMWIFWAVLTMFGLASSLKRMTERATERYCARRKLRRARARAQHEREERERCAREQRLAWRAASAQEPTLIYSTAPALAPTLDMADRLAIRQPPRPGLTVAHRPGFELDIESLEKAVASLRAAVAESA